jgi:L-2-hydroxyglutarate oxidase LhgO
LTPCALQLSLNTYDKEHITAIDDLARMINEGFKTTANKEDIKEMEDRLTTRLDRIEHLLLAEQKREIEDLKQRMKRLEDALAV